MRHKISYFYSSRASKKDVFFGKLIAIILWLFLLWLCYLGAQIGNSLVALTSMILGLLVLLGFLSFTGVFIDVVMEYREAQEYKRRNRKS